MAIVPRGITSPGPNFQVPQAAKQPELSGVARALFSMQEQERQPNLFDQINNVIQLRRKSEREAIEDQLLRDKSELELKKTRAEIAKLEKETSQEPVSGLNILEQLRGTGGEFGVTGATVDPATGSTKLTIGRTLESKKQVERIADAEKDLDKFATDAVQSINAVDKIGRFAEELGDFKVGFFQQLGAKSKFAIDEFSEDPKVAKFVGAVSQELIPAARKIMEEKGPITEGDVNRVEAGLGKKTAPLSTKIELLSELMDKIELLLNQKVERAGLTQEQFGNQFGSLLNQIQSTKTALNSILTRNKSKSEKPSRNRKLTAKSNIDTLKRLGLDPSKFEIVEE